MALHNNLGKWGENLAAEYLVTQGYAIVHRNWHVGHYEIDIIATKGNRMIFIEVKTRTDDSYDPLNAVDKRKKLYMVRAANVYLQTVDLPYEVQYDIITVIGDGHDYKLEHIPDAFVPSLTTRRGAW